ncbi:UNVERIFIED_CONTAM: hypothetical protein K2H54_018763 [Gekko kuhli]
MGKDGNLSSGNSGNLRPGTGGHIYGPRSLISGGCNDFGLSTAEYRRESRVVAVMERPPQSPLQLSKSQAVPTARSFQGVSLSSSSPAAAGIQVRLKAELDL